MPGRRGELSSLPWGLATPPSPQGAKIGLRALREEGAGVFLGVLSCSRGDPNSPVGPLWHRPTSAQVVLRPQLGPTRPSGKKRHQMRVGEHPEGSLGSREHGRLSGGHLGIYWGDHATQLGGTGAHCCAHVLWGCPKGGGSGKSPPRGGWEASPLGVAGSRPSPGAQRRGGAPGASSPPTRICKPRAGPVLPPREATFVHLSVSCLPEAGSAQASGTC